MIKGLALISLALAASPALAETPPDNDAVALQSLRLFAFCAAQQPPSGAKALLAMAPGSEEYTKAANAFARGHSSCIRVDGKMTFANLPFAGFLAEALLSRETTGSAAADTEVATGNWIEAVGACVARKQPAEVHAVLKTTPGSESEISALNPTSGSLQGCIREGQTVKLNRTAVRAMYALGVYRLSHPIQSKSEG